ncbi:MAG: tetratricopeptide repeat protein [Blastomonas sp.]
MSKPVLLKILLAALVVALAPASPVMAQDAEALFAEGLAAADDTSDWSARDTAMEKFGAACDAGLMKGCFNLGMMYRTNYDNEHSYPLLRKACDASMFDACYSIADMMLFGSGTEENRAGAQALFGRACAQGHAPACLRFGSMLEYPDEGEADERKAFAAYKKACEAGAGQGCYRVANYYRYNEQIGRNDSEARSLLEKACGLGNNSACDDFATMLRDGLAGPADNARADEIDQRLCLHADQGSACDRIVQKLKR